MGNRLKKAAGFHVVEADSERVILGITGGSGAGKTSALRAIEQLGGAVIDCDAVYHEMLEQDEALMREHPDVASPGFLYPGRCWTARSWDRRSSATSTASALLNGVVYQSPGAGGAKAGTKL